MQHRTSKTCSISRILTIALVLVLVFAYTVPQITIAQVDRFADVEALQSDVTEKKVKIEELQSKVRQLQQSINSRRSQASSLTNQISILNSRIEQSETEIEITQNQVEQTDLEIAQTQLEITQTEETIANRKDKLAALLRDLYQLERKNDLEVLLLNDTMSEFFDEFEANMQVQRNMNEFIDDLKIEKQTLQSKGKVLSDKQKSLIALREKREDELGKLEGQSIARAQLLSDTRNSEARFQKQLQQAKAEQIKVNADIQSLEKVIRQRLENEGQIGLKRLAGATAMIYPVPFRGITAQFHDPDYPYRYVFEHPAVDMRAPQGTPIKAAAPGFVARTRDAGMGYSYVMLIHADGISTVYGHVSRILVREDQFVNQGDVVALSGGTPGTPGAGRLTTGPHLHWEVRKNGIPVNPLNYVSKRLVSN